MPSRVVGANIAFEWGIYVAGIAAIALALWFGYRRLSSWGALDALRQASPRDLLTNAAEALSQRRMVRAFGLVSLFHIFIVLGFVVLLLTSAIDAISHLTGLFALEGWLYYAVSWAADGAGVVLFAGLAGLFVVKYVVRPKRQAPVSWRSGAVLLAFAFAVATGYLVEGARIAAQLLQTPDPAALSYEAVASPVGWLVAQAFRGLGLDGVLLFHRIIWWVHGLFIMVGIACLPFGKMWHVVAAFLNGAGRRPATPAPIEDYEDEASLGVEKAANLAGDDTADLYACIECGACNEACPACQAGYPLSPKQSLITALRDERNRAEAGAEPRDLSEVVGADALWSCTTCRACVDACPLHIDHVDKVIDIRRRVTLWDEEAPDELQAAFINLDMNQNPWGMGFASRGDWVRDLGLQDALVDLSEHPGEPVDYVLFAGCFAAYDLSYRRQAAAAIRLLASYGVRLGYLGVEEACCGDSARRLGNEFLYEAVVAQNREAFERHQVERLLTLCPHCLNVLANEYDAPDFAMPPVRHINEVIAELLARDGEPRPVKASAAPVVVQEPCYLDRYNSDRPTVTMVLSQAGATVLNPGDAVGPTCCGGGGGCMWMSDHGLERTRRISEARLEALQAAAGAGAQDETTVVTSCPYCYAMLTDAVSETASKTRIVDMSAYLLEQKEGKD